MTSRDTVRLLFEYGRDRRIAETSTELLGVWFASQGVLEAGGLRFTEVFLDARDDAAPCPIGLGHIGALWVHHVLTGELEGLLDDLRQRLEARLSPAAGWKWPQSADELVVQAREPSAPHALLDWTQDWVCARVIAAVILGGRPGPAAAPVTGRLPDDVCDIHGARAGVPSRPPGSGAGSEAVPPPCTASDSPGAAPRPRALPAAPQPVCVREQFVWAKRYTDWCFQRVGLRARVVRHRRSRSDEHEQNRITMCELELGRCELTAIVDGVAGLSDAVPPPEIRRLAIRKTGAALEAFDGLRRHGPTPAAISRLVGSLRERVDERRSRAHLFGDYGGTILLSSIMGGKSVRLILAALSACGLRGCCTRLEDSLRHFILDEEPDSR